MPGGAAGGTTAVALVFFGLNDIIEQEPKIDPAECVEYGLCLEPTNHPGRTFYRRRRRPFG